MEQIDCFRGDYWFLSTFYPAVILYDQQEYPTAEHLYQALKTSKADKQEWVRTAPTPALAKRRGRKVPLRFDWDTLRIDAMRFVVSQKFLQHAGLMQRLMKTGEAELIEGNRWGDCFWGVCRGRGENWLGRILMEVRGGAVFGLPKGLQ